MPIGKRGHERYGDVDVVLGERVWWLMKLSSIVLHEGGLALAGAGPWNMAVDEALYRSAHVPVLRIYRWAGPCLSLGYFSRFSDAWELGGSIAFDTLSMVRRITGGGLVEHGDDLTFALVVPRDTVPAPLLRDSVACYRWIHEAVRGALEESTVSGLSWVGAEKAIPDSGGRQGVCFEAPVLFDLMRNDRKVVGGAQKRGRHGLLHQGSIRIHGLGPGFAEALAKRLADRVIQGEGLDHESAAIAAQLETERYRDPSWLMRR